jgi:hypothetical protein
MRFEFNAIHCRGRCAHHNTTAPMNGARLPDVCPTMMALSPARSAPRLLTERLPQPLCKIASHEHNTDSQIVRRVKNYISGHRFEIIKLQQIRSSEGGLSRRGQRCRRAPLCHLPRATNQVWNELTILATAVFRLKADPRVDNHAELITEIISTFTLVFGVLTMTSTRNLVANTGLGPGLAPFLVGLLVLGIGLSLGGPTGYAINPARDLGPRIAHAFLPIPGKGTSDFGYGWIPVVGAMIGGIIGAVVDNAFSTLPPPS